MVSFLAEICIQKETSLPSAWGEGDRTLKEASGLVGLAGWPTHPRAKE